MSLRILYQLKTIDRSDAHGAVLSVTSFATLAAASHLFSNSAFRIAVFLSSPGSFADASEVTWFSRAAKLRTKNA